MHGPKRAEAGNVAHSDLAQCREAQSDDVGDVGPHGDITVDVNAKVPNSGDR